jgi:hypothetical protein
MARYARVFPCRSHLRRRPDRTRSISRTRPRDRTAGATNHGRPDRGAARRTSSSSTTPVSTRPFLNDQVSWSRGAGVRRAAACTRLLCRSPRAIGGRQQPLIQHRFDRWTVVKSISHGRPEAGALVTFPAGIAAKPRRQVHTQNLALYLDDPAGRGVDTPRDLDRRKYPAGESRLDLRLQPRFLGIPDPVRHGTRLGARSRDKHHLPPPHPGRPVMRSNVRFVASDLRPVVLDAADATLLQTVLKTPNTRSSWISKTSSHKPPRSRLRGRHGLRRSRVTRGFLFGPGFASRRSPVRSRYAP